MKTASIVWNKSSRREEEVRTEDFPGFHGDGSKRFAQVVVGIKDETVHS